MSLDVKEGDVLVVGSSEYPIKAVEDWAMQKANSPSFRSLAIQACSTKRSPEPDAEGKTGSMELYLDNLACTPLAPVTAELAQSRGLEAAHELLQTFIGDQDGFVRLFLMEHKRP